MIGMRVGHDRFPSVPVENCALEWVFCSGRMRSSPSPRARGCSSCAETSPTRRRQRQQPTRDDGGLTAGRKRGRGGRNAPSAGARARAVGGQPASKRPNGGVRYRRDRLHARGRCDRCRVRCDGLGTWTLIGAASDLRGRHLAAGARRGPVLRRGVPGDGPAPAVARAAPARLVERGHAARGRRRAGRRAPRHDRRRGAARHRPLGVRRRAASAEPAVAPAAPLGAPLVRGVRRLPRTRGPDRGVAGRSRGLALGQPARGAHGAQRRQLVRHRDRGRPARVLPLLDADAPALRAVAATDVRELDARERGAGATASRRDR